MNKTLETKLVQDEDQDLEESPNNSLPPVEVELETNVVVEVGLEENTNVEEVSPNKFAPPGEVEGR